MKRLIPVLVIALVLVLCSSHDAFSKRYPDVRLETVQWDHPWGGEYHHQDENPPILTATPSTSEDLNVFDVFKTWYRNISPVIEYNIRSLFNDNNEIVPSTLSPTETNQTTTRGGY